MPSPPHSLPRFLEQRVRINPSAHQTMTSCDFLSWTPMKVTSSPAANRDLFAYDSERDDVAASCCSFEALHTFRDVKSAGGPRQEGWRLDSNLARLLKTLIDKLGPWTLQTRLVCDPQVLPQDTPRHQRCEGVGLVKRVHTLFRRSAQVRYEPQGSGRSATGGARGKR